MREPYGKAVATRTGPAPWRCVRKDVLQALVGVRAGWRKERRFATSESGKSLPHSKGVTDIPSYNPVNPVHPVKTPGRVREQTGEQTGTVTILQTSRNKKE